MLLEKKEIAYTKAKDDYEKNKEKDTAGQKNVDMNVHRCDEGHKLTYIAVYGGHVCDVCDTSLRLLLPTDGSTDGLKRTVLRC